MCVAAPHSRQGYHVTGVVVTERMMFDFIHIPPKDTIEPLEPTTKDPVDFVHRISKYQAILKIRHENVTLAVLNFSVSINSLGLTTFSNSPGSMPREICGEAPPHHCVRHLRRRTTRCCNLTCSPLIQNPEQVPQMVQLLSESYNPHVHCSTTLALEISYTTHDV